MNPDAALAALRTAVERWHADETAAKAPDELVKAVAAAVALDEWLSAGGTLPAAWSHK